MELAGEHGVAAGFEIEGLPNLTGGSQDRDRLGLAP